MAKLGICVVFVKKKEKKNFDKGKIFFETLFFDRLIKHKKKFFCQYRLL